MLKLSINKVLFEDIILKNITTIEKEATNYWKKEFLEPKIVDNNIFYSLKKIDKIVLSNTLGNDKPQIIAECLGIDYLEDESKFKIYLGKILEQKNVGIEEQDKDKIIEQLLEENKKLKEKVKLVQQKIEFS